MANKKICVKGKAKKKNSSVVMIITKERKEHIKELSSVLSSILPTSSYYEASVTLQTIAKEFNSSQYFKKQKNKKEDYQYYLEKLIRHHERKPKMVVLEIVKQGLQKLSDKGEAFLEEDRTSIIFHMKALGFDIEKQLNEIIQPPMASLSIPTADFANLFDRLQLHPSLQDQVKQLYVQGHTNDAVRKATEIYEHTIQIMISDTNSHGDSLMNLAFNEAKPKIKMNPLKTNNDKNEQRGMMFLSKGMMAGIRNIYSHGNSATQGYIDALHFLCFISVMLKKIDNRIVPNGFEKTDLRKSN
ncbi:MAG: TIGR02391 family protein [Candidatus Cloacimonetes bacterium]|nr:TIGR02391 family protein [Candidatus Cloacimonadota bacterium]